MRIALATAILGTALVTAPLAGTDQDGRAKESLERAFSQNGRIRMDLSAGEYHISGSPDNRIRLEWSVRDPAQLPRVKARADVRDREASITTDGPTNKGLHVAIQVPKQADLYVRLTAGDLRIEGIREQGRGVARRRRAHRRRPGRGLSQRRRVGVGRRPQGPAVPGQ